ncbi:histone-lysine N-methyltransferase family member SUVH2-like [Silene latifolia]|uniref:histone-lysine N-methyltransferase family member SUVH2-like n=1 Tax=Silene latifolia TaxID=37657 RepID=UPI003D773089
MGSLVPLQDLNLHPDPTTLSPTPIRVKPEPIDDELELIPSSPPSQPPDNSNVYSEFNRISEMFRSAFAQRMERLGDVDVLNSETGAIVPVATEENRVSAVVVSPNRRQKRSNELVRVTNLSVEDQRHFRDIVRRTRMLYDALRIYSTSDSVWDGSGRRARGDLKAATIMRERGLWLNMDKRIVGSVPGVYIGDLFYFRMELCVVGLHGQSQAGIDYLPSSESSNGEPIATSIVVSGGYEDDEDSGDVLVYTGHGGQDKFHRMNNHQKLEGGNLALERSMHYGIEIRVIRGLKYEGSLTYKIYVYDGLYKVVESWFDVGKSGFGVYKYKLVRVEGQPQMGSTSLKFAHNLRTRPFELRPQGYLTLDLSMKKDNMPVFVFNDIDTDKEPLYYNYLSRTVFPPFVYGGGNMGCDCVTSCVSGCLCGMKNGGEIAYDHNGFLLRGKPLIFECGNYCSCPPNCRNRVSQKGLKNSLEVFRSRDTGWGVRTLELIPSGAFICEYTGVVLTREQAQLFTMNGDTLIYPGRFAEKWGEWGDLSQVYPDYVKPTYPSIPPLDFAMDVSSMRNVACYISHSTSPNVMVQFVLYDHNNILFPHLMLFAMENIPPLRELSLDYGVADEYTGKLSICN